MDYTAKNISVLIPTYNRPHQIKECLESLQRQTKPPLEVVIVDASEDFQSKRIIESNNFNAFEIQYYRTKPSKIDQRNFGAQQVNGKLIQLSDDDIIFNNDYC